MKKKVMIGMSGGVDSSVAAALLKEQGYEVIGVTFLLTPTGTEKAAEDAARVADALSIAHQTVDFTTEFANDVMDYFASEYQKARTPNPCIICNQKIKFGKFLEYAEQNGADFIATGHYAKIQKAPDGTYCLMTGAAGKKDQSYFLYTLTQKELSKTLMPLGEFDKEQIRRMAEDLALPVAHKPDSQDICFIPDGDYMRFLREYANYKDQKGYFKSTDGTVLGEHNGVAHFTVGQRKGLGVTFGKPMFVTGLSAETNTVYLGEQGTEFMQEFTASDLRLTSSNSLSENPSVVCKIRYSAPLVPCTVTALADGKVHIKTDLPVRAVTPGQAVVFYAGDRVLGGAVIDNMY